MTQYKVYSDGWSPLPSVNGHTAMLRVLRNDRPYDAVTAQTPGPGVGNATSLHVDYQDPFWSALLRVAADDVEVRVGQGEQPSRSPDGPVIHPSCERAQRMTEGLVRTEAAATLLLSFDTRD